jgi:hypothetical protein
MWDKTGNMDELRAMVGMLIFKKTTVLREGID